MTRVEAVKFWKECFNSGVHSGEKRPWHIGMVEVRVFLDKLYGGPPTCKEERLE
jgi:hypothetical protein